VFAGRPGPVDHGGIELPEQTYPQMLERTVGERQNPHASNWTLDGPPPMSAGHRARTSPVWLHGRTGGLA